MFENCLQTIETTNVFNEVFESKTNLKTGQISEEICYFKKEPENESEKKERKLMNLNVELDFQDKVGTDNEKITTISDLENLSSEKPKNIRRNYKKRKSQNLEDILQPYFIGMIKSSQRNGSDLFFQYIQRRNQSKECMNFSVNKIDLGVYSFKEVVQFCVKKKIISNQLFIDFSYETIFHEEEMFVKKINEKKLSEMDFERTYFTPFDHRVLSKILVEQFPDEFIYPDNLIMESSLLTSFYSFLYLIEEEVYFEVLSGINYKFNRSWIPDDMDSFTKIVADKVGKRPRVEDEESFPFYIPTRKMRKKN